MAFSLEDHMSKMHREVDAGSREGMETAIVRAWRVYPTDVMDLWDAVTRAERLSSWFLPVTGDLREGGRYQFQGNAGGSITECVRPERVSATWEFGGGMSWVTLRFEPQADGTRFELIHEAPVMPGFSDKFGPGAVGVGWDGGFMGLTRHLLDPEGYPTPADVETWGVSPEGKEFYRACAVAWGKADAAAGTPEDDAMRRAEETRAFYTGETPMTGEAPAEGS